MSIQAPSDILLDMARAADPRILTSLTQRLMQGAPEDGEGFDRALQDLPLSSASSSLSSLEPSLPTPLLNGLSTHKPKGIEAFEGFMIQKFVEEIIPKSTLSFGSGISGDIWHSMLSEQIGALLAKSHTFHLDKLFAKFKSSS